MSSFPDSFVNPLVGGRIGDNGDVLDTKYLRAHSLATAAPCTDGFVDGYVHGARLSGTGRHRAGVLACFGGRVAIA